MKLKNYLKDNLFFVLGYALLTLCIILFLNAFYHANRAFLFMILILLILFFLFFFFFDYIRKNKFYHDLTTKLEELDQKYFITEVLTSPSFLEGKITYEALYEANKSMIENMNQVKGSMKDFKDYLELWIHEVKIPLSNLVLTIHNNQALQQPKIMEQIKRLENDLDQILYYVRSENSEKDYLIKETSLKKVINQVILKNKDILLYKKISIERKNIESNVLTDSKWLEFILNQIINNSIKYAKEENAKITITESHQDNKILLKIKDNGIGIKASDLSRVFDKSFTGYNGRNSSVSTGMGLYICQNLCKKLGHKISITSRQNEFTEVVITFTKNNFYDVVK